MSLRKEICLIMFNLGIQIYLNLKTFPFSFLKQLNQQPQNVKKKYFALIIELMGGIDIPQKCFIVYITNMAIANVSQIQEAVYL